MGKLIRLAACVILIAGIRPETAIAGVVRISQIYVGGGGDASLNTALNTDYLELFNSGGTPVDVGGWLLAYGGSNPTSSFGCAGCTLSIPSGALIQPCSYFLIQISPRSFDYGTDIPAPDATLLFGNGLGGVGVMGLFSNGTPVGICPKSLPGLQDLVGWASACDLGSSSGVPAIDRAHALLRTNEGMSWTGDHSMDFALATPNPRNSTSPQSVICLQTPARPGSWGRLKVVYR